MDYCHFHGELSVAKPVVVLLKCTCIALVAGGIDLSSSCLCSAQVSWSNPHMKHSTSEHIPHFEMHRFLAFTYGPGCVADLATTCATMLSMLCVLCMLADHLEQEPPVLHSSLLCLPDLLFLISSRQLAAQA